MMLELSQYALHPVHDHTPMRLDPRVAEKNLTYHECADRAMLESSVQLMQTERVGQKRWPERTGRTEQKSDSIDGISIDVSYHRFFLWLLLCCICAVADLRVNDCSSTSEVSQWESGVGERESN